MTGVTDAELLKLLRERPEEGCTALLRQYTGLVLAIVRRKLGGCTFCSAEDMEELTSDILFSFWQQRERIDPEKGSIRALLAVSASRRCIDWYRARAAKPVSEPLEPFAETVADPALTPEDVCLTKERRQQLMQAILSLGEPDAEILIRKYYAGETASVIAERLSMRTGTVEMRISRAYQKLRNKLEGGAES